MSKIIKWSVVGLIVFLLGVAGGVYFSGEDELDDSAKHHGRVIAPTNEPVVSNAVNQKEAVSPVEVNKDSIDVVQKDVLEREEVEEASNDSIKMDKKALLKIMGATDALAWQEEYDKGVYTPAYDLTWQDDMFNRAHQLVIDEAFSDDIEMKEITCENDQCSLTLIRLPSSTKGAGQVASDFILALKEHPSILESGRSRNVYINFIKNFDDDHVVDLVIR